MDELKQIHFDYIKDCLERKSKLQAILDEVGDDPACSGIKNKAETMIKEIDFNIQNSGKDLLNVISPIK